MGDRSRGRAAMAVVFLLFSGLYLFFAAPGPLFGDSGEFQTLGAVGGIAHQPGYPLYVIVGRGLGMLLPGNPAYRMNCMSCLFGGLAVGMLGLVLLELGVPAIAAVAGAVAYGAGFTVWWFSIRAEVYSLAAFLFLSAFLVALRALRIGSFRLYFLAAVLSGFAFVTHLTLGPALIVLWLFLLLPAAAGISRFARVTAAAAGLLVGLSPYLYAAWIDSGTHPLNYLAYSIDAAAGQFGLTPETFDEPWERIGWLLFGSQAKMTFYLFDPRGLMRNLAHLLSIEFVYHYGPLSMPLAAIGIVVSRRRMERRLPIILAVAVVSSALVILYGALHLIPVFSLAVAIADAILVSFGIAWVIDRLRRRGRRRTAIVAAIVLAALVVVPAHALRMTAERTPAVPVFWRMPMETGPRMTGPVPSLRGYDEARQFGETVLVSVPENCLVTGDWYEMIVLFYLRYAEERRTDISLEIGYAEHFDRIRRWASRPGPDPRPVVFLEPMPGLTGRFAPCDTMRLAGGRCLLLSDGSPRIIPSRRSGGTIGR